MINRKPTLHLICGLPASGKSTYAKKLKQETKGVIFSIDDWLTTCFGAYLIDSVGHPEHIRRVIACRKLILEVSGELLKRGADVILDDGFFLQKDRNKYKEFAKKLSANVIIHYLDSDIDTIKSRIVLRNSHLPKDNFMITPKLLDEMIAMFEKPDRSEGTIIYKKSDLI